MFLLNFAYLIFGLVGLYFGGEFLVKGSSRVALALKISPLIIGLTIVAIGTSAPELFVSIIAAFQDRPGIALGNVIGSNIANIGLILGFTGALRALTVQETLIKREIPILVVITLYATIMILDGNISRIDGFMLLFGFGVFNYLFLQLARNPQKTEEAVDVEMPEEDVDHTQINIPLEVGRILVGVVLLVIGGNSMVAGASNIALAVGVSELVVGVTVVAFGTSLPELATSLTAAMKGETDIAIGNVIGSNVANLLLVLGATSAITPINVGTTDLSIIEYMVMLGFTFMLIPFARNRELSRAESALFLGIYVAFIAYSFFPTAS
jgi:cation:H+ antiporter